MESTVTVKGQVTLPKAIRDQLHLSPGDRVRFFVDSDGRVVMLPKLPITALKGIVKVQRNATVTIEEMDEAIAEGIVDRYLSAVKR